MAPMGKTLDRYLLREVLSPFLVGLVVYTFTLLINNVLLLSQALISKEASAATVLLILLYFLPALLSFTVPMATLMGVLSGLSRMSTDSEIVALRQNNLRSVTGADTYFISYSYGRLPFDRSDNAIYEMGFRFKF